MSKKTDKDVESDYEISEFSKEFFNGLGEYLDTLPPVDISELDTVRDFGDDLF